MYKNRMASVKKMVAKKQRQVRVNRLARCWNGESSKFKGFGKAGK